MGSAWDRMGKLRRIAMLVVLAALVAGIASVAIGGDWYQVTRGVLALVVFIWLLAPLGEFRERTTGRLSTAQGLALGLVASIAFVIFRVVAAREVPFVALTIVLIGLAGFLYLLANQGWSGTRERPWD